MIIYAVVLHPTELTQEKNYESFHTSEKRAKQIVAERQETLLNVFPYLKDERPWYYVIPIPVEES